MGNVVQPVASSLVESLRAFGYSFETAVADIIDNSIYAQSKKIEINFDWSGPQTSLSIVDDGIGMNRNELIEAMRPGTKSPMDERNVKDLGRFGLGLKTASFSQCRRLIVCSKQNSQYSICCWDLDVIRKKNEWYLLDEDDLPNSDKYLQVLNNKKTGTAVFWEDIDRACQDLDSSSAKHHSKFLDIISLLEFHLSMTFHRFLQLPKGPQLILNGSKIKPWDPFMSKHPSIQTKKCDIDYKGGRLPTMIFILPHHSKLTDEEYKAGQGVRGWNDYQGFYVYRNKRLLISGDWLGIGGSKEEHAKLARIRIDLPNTLDMDWHIDVKKSKAFPPPILREQLKIIASKARSEATSIYRHRGKIVKRTSSADDIVIVWKRIKRRGKYYFTLNSDYPLVKKIQQSLPSNSKSDFRSLLRLIGETVPSPAIAVTHSEEPDTLGKPYDGCSNELKQLGISLYNELLKAGFSKKEVVRKLSCIEPFDSYPEFLEVIEEESRDVD